MTRTDARACRPSIPDPSRPHPTCPRPAPPRPRTPAPAGLPGQRPRPAGCPWPPPPAGRHPGLGGRRGAGRGAVDRRDRRVGHRRAPAGPGRARRPPPRSRPLQRPGRGHPSAARSAGWTPTSWPAPSARGWPTGTATAIRTVPDPQPAGGRWPSTARPCAAPAHLRQAAAARCTCWPAWTTPPAGAGPTPGRRRTPGGPRVRPAAGRVRPGRGGGHRRRATDPPRGRQVPGDRKAGPLPVCGHGQPAHAAGALRPPAVAPRARGRPHPRPRPRPRRVAHPQGDLRPPLRVPARRPGPPGHPQDPRPAHHQMAGRDRVCDHQPLLRAGPSRPPGRPAAWALGDRSAASYPRCHLRRGRLPTPHRQRPKRDGSLAQPGHRRAVPGGTSQPRRCPAPPRPRPTPTLASLGISLG
jgi:hypothetical protein